MSGALDSAPDVEGNERLLAGAGLLALVIAPFILGPFQMGLLAEVLIFGIFATAFNLLYGYTGLLSFGHGMFFAVAGYTMAKTVQVVGPMLSFGELFGGASVLATWLFGLVLAILVTVLVAMAIGYLAVQLEEIYFAMITLSFTMAIYAIANQDIIGTLLEFLGIGNGTFTNGSDGLTFTLGEVDLFGFTFTLVDIADPFAYYFFTIAIFSVTMYLLYRIVKSPFGTVCKAIRENPERASALGIDITRHSWVTFVISGGFSGLAGGLLIPLFTNVTPRYAYWSFSAEPVLMTVIGGPYSFFGPLVGAFSYRYLRWFISRFEMLEAYWQFSFGLLLLLVVLFVANGIIGAPKQIRSWLDSRGE
ncbi:branched-chain amino acid ABC transporter permease [Halosegnis longus]|uniref:Branched-chain amino acid ABC transporter permease n=1 Tax=Halosegnis longus TaxID=2216012 RepID=A0AAJ4R6G5_9EURY|nr:MULTISPECIES: branched-chain amino acid ABC transporter permease [Halobacteriales]RNJ25443.1 branched-chain amino acid ABC transporter permease [Salella cibi]